jgi:hypothetical protein
VSDAFNWYPDGLPDELLAMEPMALLQALERPTLIRVPGSSGQRPRAISTLLHGDESTGYAAVLAVLRARHTYAFDLYVVLGNVRAALDDGGFKHRFLDDQEDFNRVWGLGDPTTLQRQAADGILEILRGADLESLVDIHNNSGDNPFYAIVRDERPETLHLATRFTTTLLFWDLGAATLMEAIGGSVAALAIECGLPGRPESTAFAIDGLRRYLGAKPLPTENIRVDFDMLRKLRKVHVRPEVNFSFGGKLDHATDFVVAAGADRANFVEVDKGYVLGKVHFGAALPLSVTAADGTDVTSDHFAVIEGDVVLLKKATPVMMTRTVEAARKDCLFYLASGAPSF